MSLLGKMFDADEIKGALEKKVKEEVKGALKEKMGDNDWLSLMTQVAEKYKKGESAAEIAKDLMKDKELIETIIEVVKDNPKLDGSAVAALLKKLK